MAKKISMMDSITTSFDDLQTHPPTPQTPVRKEKEEPKTRAKRTKDPTTVFSISAPASLRESLKAAAKKHNVTVNSLHRFLLTRGLTLLEEGKIKLPTESAVVRIPFDVK